MKLNNKWLYAICISFQLFLNSFYLFSCDYEIPKVNSDSVRTNVLPNGFTYYIVKNSNPKSKIEMRLLVKAGFNNEEPDQLEISHLIEHLAFVETTHFTNVLEYFQKKGLVKFRDISGLTGLDRTEYYAIIPSYDKSLTLDGLKFLRDCADGIIITPENINKERGVVLEEIDHKYGESADSKAALDQKLRTDGKVSRPFVDPRHQLSETSSYDAVSRFYDKWYRPEMQSIVVVGDFNIDSMENYVRSMFSDLKQRVSKVSPAIPSNAYTIKNNYVSMPYAESGGIEVNIHQKIRNKPEYRLLSPKEEVIIEIFNSLMRNRLKDERKPGSNGHITFDDVGGTYGGYTSLLLYHKKISPEVISLGGIEKEVKDLFKEIYRVRKYGFTQSEFERDRKRMSLKFENVFKTSDAIASVFGRHFLYGEPLYDIIQRRDASLLCVNELQLDDFNKFVFEWIDKDDDIDVVLFSKEQNSEIVPEYGKVLKWMAQSKMGEIAPYKDTESGINGIELISKKELNSLSSSFSKEYISGVDGTKIILPNGVVVILKPVNQSTSLFFTDKIFIEGFRPRGTISSSASDAASAYFFDKVIEVSGRDGIDSTNLSRFRKTYGIEIQPYIGESAEGIRGSVNKKDIESGLQFIYLNFTKPKFDTLAMQRYIASQVKNLKDHLGEQEIFPPLSKSQQSELDLLLDANTYNEKRSISPNDIFSLYTNVFSDAKNFTFVMSGDFELEDVSRLAAKYLGTLPSSSKANTPIWSTKAKAVLQNGNIDSSVTIYNKTSQSDVILRISGTYEYGSMNNSLLKLLSRNISSRLYNELRLRQGVVYGAGADVTYAKMRDGKGWYDFSLGFTTLSCNFDSIIKSVIGVVDELRVKTMSKEELQDTINMERGDISDNMKNHHFVFNYLTRQLKNGESLDEINANLNNLNHISPDDFKKAAKQYLDKSKLRLFMSISENCKGI